MNKQTIAQNFTDNHHQFTDYVSSLNEDQFVKSKFGKWSPAQQLEHIYLVNLPLAQVLGNKSFIEQKFGKTNREGMSNEEILKTYKSALEKGGKAPDRFVPAEVNEERRTELITKINADLKSITTSLDNYSELELDALVLPHPLLGNLSIREMLYLMSYHALHHLEKIKENL